MPSTAHALHHGYPPACRQQRQPGSACCSPLGRSRQPWGLIMAGVRRRRGTEWACWFRSQRQGAQGCCGAAVGCAGVGGGAAVGRGGSRGVRPAGGAWWLCMNCCCAARCWLRSLLPPAPCTQCSPWGRCAPVRDFNEAQHNKTCCLAVGHDLHAHVGDNVMCGRSTLAWLWRACAGASWWAARPLMAWCAIKCFYYLFPTVCATAEHVAAWMGCGL